MKSYTSIILISLILFACEKRDCKEIIEHPQVTLIKFRFVNSNKEDLLKNGTIDTSHFQIINPETNEVLNHSFEVNDTTIFVTYNPIGLERYYKMEFKEGTKHLQSFSYELEPHLNGCIKNRLLVTNYYFPYGFWRINNRIAEFDFVV